MAEADAVFEWMIAAKKIMSEAMGIPRYLLKVKIVSRLPLMNDGKLIALLEPS
jgi:hypothetical protein